VQTKMDNDGKLSIIKKDDIKSKIGRSPDYSDAIMMRMYYELDKMEEIEEKEETVVFDEMSLLIDDDEYDEKDETYNSPY